MLVEAEPLEEYSLAQFSKRVTNVKNMRVRSWHKLMETVNYGDEERELCKSAALNTRKSQSRLSPRELNPTPSAESAISQKGRDVTDHDRTTIEQSLYESFLLQKQSDVDNLYTANVTNSQLFRKKMRHLNIERTYNLGVLDRDIKELEQKWETLRQKKMATSAATPQRKTSAQSSSSSSSIAYSRRRASDPTIVSKMTFRTRSPSPRSRAASVNCNSSQRASGIESRPPRSKTLETFNLNRRKVSNTASLSPSNCRRKQSGPTMSKRRISEPSAPMKLRNASPVPDREHPKETTLPAMRNPSDKDISNRTYATNAAADVGLRQRSDSTENARRKMGKSIDVSGNCLLLPSKNLSLSCESITAEPFVTRLRTRSADCRESFDLEKNDHTVATGNLDSTSIKSKSTTCLFP